MNDQLELDLPIESFIRRRDFHGYAQFRESEKCPWSFYICGFDHTTSGQDGKCTVLRSDGSKEWVTIDKKDRLLILGKKFGRRYWNH